LNKIYSERNDSADVTFNLVILNNGAILKATVGNIDFIDISKHITGSLRHKLKEMGCVVQKGDFDYSRGDDCEKMTKDNQAFLLPYIEGDVLALKKLIKLLNQSCFEKFGVELNIFTNIFMSTSQLTYAVWVNFLYNERKNAVFLQTPEHEKFFRESIYGGTSLCLLTKLC
jgi:hypothetical protein